MTETWCCSIKKDAFLELKKKKKHLEMNFFNYNYVVRKTFHIRALFLCKERVSE